MLRQRRRVMLRQCDHTSPGFPARRACRQRCIALPAPSPSVGPTRRQRDSSARAALNRWSRRDSWTSCRDSPAWHRFVVEYRARRRAAIQASRHGVHIGYVQSKKLINQILNGPPYFGSGFRYPEHSEAGEDYNRGDKRRYNSEGGLPSDRRSEASGRHARSSLDYGATGLLTFQFVSSQLDFPDQGRSSED